MLLALALACTAPMDSAAGGAEEDPHPWGTAEVPRGGPVDASGHAFSFSPTGGRVAGATIGIVELPEHTTTTAADGAWRLPGLPRGQWVTFTLSHPEHVEVWTGTFLLGHPDDGGDALEGVTFQAPTLAMFDLLEGALGVGAAADRCQISTTVTRRGHSLYDTGGTHGEPGATAALGPDPGDADGPVYFNVLPSGAIYPDRDLGETTEDGGVQWANVPVGTHVLAADKAGADIRGARVRCEAGVLVNPSPPWGLQVRSGGLEPREG